MKRSFYLLLGLALCGGQIFSQDLKDALRQADYPLTGFIDNKKSDSFACMFGSYQVHLKGKKDGEVMAGIEGIGFVVNSKSLLPQAIENGKIAYFFPAEKNLKDGIKLSSFCISRRIRKEDSGLKVGESQVDYFVLERS